MPSTSRCLRSSEQVARTSPSSPFPLFIPFSLPTFLSCSTLGCHLERPRSRGSIHLASCPSQRRQQTLVIGTVPLPAWRRHICTYRRRCGGVPHIPKTRRFDPWRRPNNFWCPPLQKEFRAAVLAGHLRSSVRLCCPSSVCTIFRQAAPLFVFFFSLSRMLSVSFLTHLTGHRELLQVLGEHCREP